MCTLCKKGLTFFLLAVSDPCGAAKGHLHLLYLLFVQRAGFTLYREQVYVLTARAPQGHMYRYTKIEKLKMATEALSEC